MTGSVYALLTGGATHQFSTQVTWYTCMHQGTNSLSLSLSLLPPTAPSSGRPNNNIPGHQGEQQVHAARWDAELCFRRGYTKIEKYSVSPAPSKAPAHSSLHIRSLRHTHTQATPAQTGTAPPPCVRDEGVLLAQANVWANERAHQEKELSIARTGGT